LADQKKPVRKSPGRKQPPRKLTHPVEDGPHPSDSTFRYLAEESPNMIFINAGGRVVYANLMCERLMEYSREELYAPDFDFLRLIAPF